MSSSEDIMTDHRRLIDQHKPCREFGTCLISLTDPASIAPANKIQELAQFYFYFTLGMSDVDIVHYLEGHYDQE